MCRLISHQDEFILHAIAEEYDLNGIVTVNKYDPVAIRTVLHQRKDFHRFGFRTDDFTDTHFWDNGGRGCKPGVCAVHPTYQMSAKEPRRTYIRDLQHRVLEPTYDIAGCFPKELFDYRLDDENVHQEESVICDENGWPVSLVFRDHQWGEHIETERQVCTSFSYSQSPISDFLIP